MEFGRGLGRSRSTEDYPREGNGANGSSTRCRAYVVHKHGRLRRHLKAVTAAVAPRRIVEIGILDGFSLACVCSAAPGATIEAYDIFEDFTATTDFPASVFYQELLATWLHTNLGASKEGSVWPPVEVCTPPALRNMEVDPQSELDPVRFNKENHIIKP